MGGRVCREFVDGGCDVIIVALTAGAASMGEAASPGFPVFGPNVYQPGPWPLGRPYEAWDEAMFRFSVEGNDPAVLRLDDCSAWK